MTDSKEQVSTAMGGGTKAKRIPRGGESITKGALALPLAERAALRDELIKSVDDEKKKLREIADEADKL